MKRDGGLTMYRMRIIEDGFRLPFIKLPCRRVLSNPSSCSLHAEFTTEAVADLVAQGCAVKAGWEEAMVCSPLGVLDNRRKLRLTLDLCCVNKHLAKLKFKIDMR